jgi:hypothetical protein
MNNLAFPGKIYKHNAKSLSSKTTDKKRMPPGHYSQGVFVGV